METPYAIRAFDNFSKLYPIFVRITQEEKLRDQLRINQHRHLPHLAPGDVVFRKMPSYARPPKKLLHAASEGPYFVVKQRSPSSVVLADALGEPVDEGHNIPLTQIILGPRREPVVFESHDEVRSTGEMMMNPSPYGGKMGKKAGQQIGWTSLCNNQFVLYRAHGHEAGNGAPRSARSRQLLLGKVLQNFRETERVVMQPYRGKWTHSKVRYVPLYQSAEGHTERPGDPVQESVPYADLIYEAGLKQNGELSLNTEAKLRKGSWGLLHINDAEQIVLLEEARARCAAEPIAEESAENDETDSLPSAAAGFSALHAGIAPVIPGSRKSPT